MTTPAPGESQNRRDAILRDIAEGDLFDPARIRRTRAENRRMAVWSGCVFCVLVTGGAVAVAYLDDATTIGDVVPLIIGSVVIFSIMSAAAFVVLNRLRYAPKPEDAAETLDHITTRLREE